MAATSKEFKFIFDASTRAMATGLQAGARALDDLKDEALGADIALRAMPNDVDVDVDVGLRQGTVQKLRSRLIAEQAKLEASLNDVEVGVEVDTFAATAKLKKIQRELKQLDRFDAKPEVKIDTDGNLGLIAKQVGQLGGALGSVGSAGPVAAAGLAAVGRVIATSLGPGLAGGAFAAAVGGVGIALLSGYDEIAKANQKFATVFGDQGQEITEWAESISTRVGQGVLSIKSGAADIADLLKPQGFAGGQLLGLTKEIYTSGAAMAEWTDKIGSAEEGSQILAKALLGEREQLKLAGLDIKEKGVQERIAILAAKDGYEDLTDKQLKSLATLELIQESGKDMGINFEQGTNEAGEALNALDATLANVKDNLIEGFGGVAAGIIADLDFGDDLLGGLKDIPGWFKENGPEIRKTMLQIAEAAVLGGAAFLELAAGAAASIDPILGAASGFARGVGSMIETLQNLPSNWLLDKFGVIPDPQKFYDIADGMDSVGDAARLIDPAIQGANDSVQSAAKDIAKALATLPSDTVLNIQAAVAKGDLDAVRAEIDGLTKAEVKQILAELPEKNRSQTEKEFAELAKDRLAEIKAEAKTDKAAKDINRFLNVPRWMTLNSRADMSGAQKDIDAYIARFPSWLTLQTRATVATRVVDPVDDGATLEATGTRTTSSGGVVVNLDGRVVSAALSDRMNRQMREVWV